MTYKVPPPDLPPDPGRLADALEEIRKMPPTVALEELEHLLETMPRVAAVMRRREGLRRVAALLASGEYASVRRAAERVGPETGVAPDTVRQWWAERPVDPPAIEPTTPRP